MYNIQQTKNDLSRIFGDKRIISLCDIMKRFNPNGHINVAVAIANFATKLEMLAVKKIDTPEAIERDKEVRKGMQESLEKVAKNAESHGLTKVFSHLKQNGDLGLWQ